MRIVWPLAASLLLSACASVPIPGGAAPDSGHMRDRYRASYLHADGQDLVSAAGRKVELHGINLGGWLVTEDWMCGFTDAKDTPAISGSAGIAGRWALESLEDRFGAANAAALMGVWQDHWITARDLDDIGADGFNLVRVPISYRTLQTADGRWTLDSRGRIDFSRLDWIVRQAAARGIYTIIDLHVWPGQRFDYQKVGRPEGRDVRDAMARLWTAIAAHYRGDGAVAAFDLINEFPGSWGVQQVLAQAVRAGDPDRVVVVEGFSFPEFLKLYQDGAFPNSVFSEHLYGDNALTTEELASRLQDIRESPAPIYIGEFLPADFASATQVMTMLNFAWSTWTYKTVDMGDWGVMNYRFAPRTDIQAEDFAAISASWATDLTAWQAHGSLQSVTVNEDRHPPPNPTPAAPLP